MHTGSFLSSHVWYLTLTNLRSYEHQSPNLRDDQWHHVCFTWRNSDGQWYLYIDGLEKASGDSFKTHATVEGGPLVLGQGRNGSGTLLCFLIGLSDILLKSLFFGLSNNFNLPSPIFRRLTTLSNVQCFAIVYFDRTKYSSKLIKGVIF